MKTRAGRNGAGETAVADAPGDKSIRQQRITVLSIDAELSRAVAAVAAPTPPTPPIVGDWKTRRANIDGAYAAIAAAATHDDRTEVVDFTVSASDGHTVPLRLYKPSNVPNVLVVYLHGGGLIAGASMDTTKSAAVTRQKPG